MKFDKRVPLLRQDPLEIIHHTQKKFQAKFSRLDHKLFKMNQALEQLSEDICKIKMWINEYLVKGHEM